MTYSNLPEQESPQEQEYEGRDRQPVNPPEKVEKSSHEAEQNLYQPKEQPDHNKPGPDEDSSGPS